MAKYAEEIEKMIHVNFHGSMDNIPEETRYTILLYHQVLCHMPLFLCYDNLSLTMLVCHCRHKASASLRSEGEAREARPSGRRLAEVSGTSKVLDIDRYQISQQSPADNRRRK